MTTTISALRDGLQVRLATIGGLRTSDTYPDQVNAPQALVGNPDVEYHQTYGSGYAVITFEIILLAFALQKGVKRGQDALDSYLNSTDANSVKKAIEGDCTLGGIAHDLIVKRVYDYGQIAYGDVPYAGCKWRVEVHADL